ncbi:heterokaryon incompatibility protein-domain-containing protein [Phaeosphaeriaceae sp. PMI808]|nr:heterokaryon incompatibility protein-domain-containing protein [Phaeosphaeriaceae sp. PMI808]
MRLLNVKTRCLEEFTGDTIPPYAILSHTWGREEVTFQDLPREDHKQKYGYRKIEGCCQAAAEQRIKYVWIDSCCIDKSSSAELSEAINSMFKWYKASNMCFIFLEDVPTNMDPFPLDSAFRKSRWWTRGWTLQELLAPHHTIFFDSIWERIFTPEMGLDIFQKIDLPARFKEVVKRPQHRSEDRFQTILQQIRYELISQITGIPRAVLVKDLPLSEVSAACKFSWASQRMTTRVEDKAYCLMGLLDVSLPLLYGEGDRAFIRLQETVISNSDDISLLAWGYNLTWEAMEELGVDKILARSPAAFSGYPKWNHEHIRSPPKTHSTVTGHGLHIELPLLLIDARHRVWIGVIEESVDRDGAERCLVALVLRQKSAQDTNTFERARGCPIQKISYPHHLDRRFRRAISRMIYLQDGFTTITSTIPQGTRSLVHSWSFLTSMTKSIGQTQYTAELAIFIKNFRSVGYIVSSRYPPIDHDLVSLAIPKAAEEWKLSGGQIETKYKSDYELPLDYLLCQGPGNGHFYYTLANSEGHSVAVKVTIKYRPPFIDSYEVRLSRCGVEGDTTALEYAGSKGLWTRGLKQPPKKAQWNNYVNLWSPSKTKIHVSVVPTHQKLSNKNILFAQCSLVWTGGWISESLE